MCEPATISMGLMAAGYLYSAYTKRQAGMYNEKFLRQQGEFTSVMARTAAAREQMEEQEVQRQGHGVEARQKMMAAASGIEPTSGSMLDITTGTRTLVRQDVDTLRANLQSELWSYGTEKWQAEARARSARWEGDTGAISDVLSGVGETLLMGSSLGMFKGKALKTAGAGGVGSLDATFSPSFTPEKYKNFGFNRAWSPAFNFNSPAL